MPGGVISTTMKLKILWAFISKSRTCDVKTLPVGCCPKCSAFGSHSHGVDLCRVQLYAVSKVILPPKAHTTTYPWNALPPNTKENVVQEEESDRSFRPSLVGTYRQRRVFVVSNTNGDDRVAEKLTGCSVHHHLPSPPAFDIRYANERKEEVRNRVTCG
jgi:hypothetical protein